MPNKNIPRRCAETWWLRASRAKRACCVVSFCCITCWSKLRRPATSTDCDVPEAATWKITTPQTVPYCHCRRLKWKGCKQFSHDSGRDKNENKNENKNVFCEHQKQKIKHFCGLKNKASDYPFLFLTTYRKCSLSVSMFTSQASCHCVWCYENV